MATLSARRIHHARRRTASPGDQQPEAHLNNKCTNSTGHWVLTSNGPSMPGRWPGIANQDACGPAVVRFSTTVTGDLLGTVLHDDPVDVVLVGHSFGDFIVPTPAAENPGMPVVYVAAWLPRSGASVIDLFPGSDRFADGDEAGGANSL